MRVAMMRARRGRALLGALLHEWRLFAAASAAKRHNTCLAATWCAA